MKDKTNLIAIILVIVTIIVLVIAYISKDNNKTKEEKINIVTNYSNFYTVDSCLNRFIIYLSSKDTDSIMSIINDDFIKKNDITKDNVLDLFDEVKDGSNFVSKKMYYTKVNENIDKYYVYGSVEYSELQIDHSSTTELNDTYFIVYIDKYNHLYSIEPYYGSLFTSGEIYE